MSYFLRKCERRKSSNEQSTVNNSRPAPAGSVKASLFSSGLLSTSSRVLYYQLPFSFLNGFLACIPGISNPFATNIKEDYRDDECET